MYKFLLFDLDNTLLNFDKAEDIALNLLLKGENVTNIQEYKDFYLKMNKKLWLDLEQNKISRQELVNTRFYKLFNHFGIKKDGMELAEKYQFYLGNQGVALRGAISLLENLKNDYEIYAATNGITKIQQNRLRNSKISKYFKKVFISEEIGYVKPSKEFYQYVSKNIPGFNKKEALMIGDNLFADIYGANSFDIDTLYFNPTRKLNTTNIKPTYEAHSFKDIFNILKEVKNGKL